MTEKELSWKSNRELAGMLLDMINNEEEGLKYIQGTKEAKEAAMDCIRLQKEIYKRLLIEHHITFEDESFDM